MKTSARVQTGLLYLFQPGYVQNGIFTVLTPERALWMLAYLAIHDRWVSRDEVARLLWPDADPEAARAALRQLLYRTKTLGLAPALEVERTQLRWLEGSDLHLFRKAYQSKDWSKVIELYRGELLQGFDDFEAEEFSAWLEIERRDLSALWREAAQNQAAIFEQIGHFGEAANLLERILRSDPLAEDVMCEYLRLAQQSGRHDRALELYRGFVQQLELELALEPRVETQRLFGALRSSKTPKPPEPILIEQKASNLPLPTTPFFGRLTEMQWLLDKLQTPGVRVISLVGPGGIGKTHLSLEAARRFAGRALFVSLVGQDAGQSLAPAVAKALGLTLLGREHPEAELLGLLRGQSLLLVLDNVEQVLEEARQLASSLADLENVQLLFTSRVRLALLGEHTLEVGGLSFPQKGVAASATESYDAVRLLLETVWRVVPDTKLSAADQAEAIRIAQSVRGVPLALVLAGSWARMLSLGEIAAELEKNLDFLQGALQGLPPRHQGMREVFEYSWRLLSAPQQQTLAGLSVFRGGFERTAVVAITGASNVLLLGLLDSSLIRRVHGEAHRFDLHELVRQYAQEKLEADPQQSAAVRQRHAQWFMGWAEQIQLRKQRGLDQAQWMHRIEQEHDNLRAALSWAEEQGLAEVSIRLGRAVALFWRGRGYASEGWGWLTRALGQLGGLKGSPLHASALAHIGDLALYQGDLAKAAQAYRQALEVSRADDPETLRAMNGLGAIALYQPDYPLARQRFSELLERSRRLGDTTTMATALNNLGLVHEYEGDYPAAQQVHQEGLGLRIEIGDAYGQSVSLLHLGNQARHLGDYKAAQQYLEQSLELSSALEDRQTMLMTFNSLGNLAFQRADYLAAQSFYRQGLNLSRMVPYKRFVAEALEGVAGLLGATGQSKTAAQLLGQAELLRETTEAIVPSALARYQSQRADIQSTLGEVGFSIAILEGRSRSLEQALELAQGALDANAVG